MKTSIKPFNQFRAMPKRSAYADLLIIFTGILVAVYLAGLSYEFGLYIKSLFK